MKNLIKALKNFFKLEIGSPEGRINFYGGIVIVLFMCFKSRNFLVDIVVIWALKVEPSVENDFVLIIQCLLLVIYYLVCVWFLQTRPLNRGQDCNGTLLPKRGSKANFE